MKILESIGSVLKLVFVCGCIYPFVQWEFNELQVDENSANAEHACANEIRDRLDVPSVTVYAINETDNDYVVRASATLARGTPVKVYCLTNQYGGVEEIRVKER